MSVRAPYLTEKRQTEAESSVAMRSSSPHAG